MDHIMGIPTMVRHHHASPLPFDIYGPPGIVERIDHLIRGYEWNLCESTWFTMRVHEVHDDRILHYSFPGPEGFPRRYVGKELRTDRTIWASRYVTVEAELLDHKIPVLAFRTTERPPFSVAPQLLEEQGLLSGEWIRDLKRRVWKGDGNTPVMVSHRDGDGVREEAVNDPVALYAAIRKEQHAASVGYVSDVGWTADNIRKMAEFLSGLTLLCVECTFLGADEVKARASYHLCSRDLNELMARLAPSHVIPMHLSKSYLRRSDDLYRELQPPAGTTVIRLPIHIVPPPLTVADVKGWLRP
jgi:ribonuclease Z